MERANIQGISVFITCEGEYMNEKDILEAADNNVLINISNYF